MYQCAWWDLAGCMLFAPGEFSISINSRSIIAIDIPNYSSRHSKFNVYNKIWTFHVKDVFLFWTAAGLIGSWPQINKPLFAVPFDLHQRGAGPQVSWGAGQNWWVFTLIEPAPAKVELSWMLSITCCQNSWGLPFFFLIHILLVVSSRSKRTNVISIVWLAPSWCDYKMITPKFCTHQSSTVQKFWGRYI